MSTINKGSSSSAIKKLISAAMILCCIAASGCNAQTDTKSTVESAAVASVTESAAESVPVQTADAPEKLYSSTQKEIDSPDWVKALPEAKAENNKQLFIVGGLGMDKTTATISMHQKDEKGNWKQIMSTPGYIGLNGMCLDRDHSEGAAQTPIGTYHFNKAFGIADDPGCAIPYIKVDDDTYWSGDDREGYHYNEMVDIKDYPDLNMDNSEHIVHYEYEYQYCLNISFNEDAVPGKGSAIFLHCIGAKKPYTGGCVAIPENKMKFVMQNVDPDCVVVIDTFEKLGGEF